MGGLDLIGLVMILIHPVDHLGCKLSFLGDLVEDSAVLGFLYVRGKLVLPAVHLIQRINEGAKLLQTFILMVDDQK